MSQIDTIKKEVEPKANTIGMHTRKQSLFRRFITRVFRPSARQGLVVLVDQSFCSIANFLTGVMVARACSKEEYGLYVLGFTLLITVMGIQTSLSGTPFTVLSQRLKAEEHRFYLGSTLVQHLVVSGVAAVGIAVAAVVLSASGQKDGFANVLAALAAASVFVLLRDFMRYVLLAEFRVWASLFMGLFINLATIGILLWAYVSHWLTGPVAYLIVAGCSGPPVLLVLLSKRKEIAFTTNKLREHLQENCKFGKWLLARIPAFFFAAQIYPWALLIFKGPSAVGVYGVCITLARIVNPFFAGVSRYLGPKTAHAACQTTANVRRVVWSAIAILVGPILFFLIGIIIFGNWAIGTMFGDKYQQGGHVLFVLALGISIGALTSPITSGIDALCKPRINFLAQLIGASVSLTVGVALVYAFGPLGAALGYVLSIAFNTLYRWKHFSIMTRDADAVRCSTSERRL